MDDLGWSFVALGRFFDSRIEGDFSRFDIVRFQRVTLLFG